MRLLRLVSVAALVAILFLSSSLPLASALSAPQRKIFNTGIFYFDIGTSGGDTGSGCSDTTLSGSDNVQKAYNYIVGKGLPAQGAAGILGNWMIESHVDPTIEQTPGAWLDMSNDYNHAVGIVQWDGPRRVAIIKAAHSHGFSNSDLKNGASGLLAFELDYFWDELTTGYKGTYAQLQKETDPQQAAVDFLIGFEEGDYAKTHPDQVFTDKRKASAQKIFDQFGSGSGSGSGTNCIISQSTDCTNVSGDAKILCEAEKYQGIYYRLGGGHQDYQSFVAGCPDPSNPPNNQPSGGANSGNPSPCATDCTGLINVAMDKAFGGNYGWYVSAGGFMEGSGTQYWQSIPIKQAKAGDIVTVKGSEGHVEIILKVQGSTISTFGSHSTGSKTGPVTTPSSYWTGGAWHWTGQGSSS